MALIQRLAVRQSQALVMTPQLMQAIKLLQLSNVDVAGYVEGELERNPLLERIDDREADRPAEEIAASTDAEVGGAGDGVPVVRSGAERARVWRRNGDGAGAGETDA